MKLLVLVIALLLVSLDARAQQRLPILDVHLHASAADENGPPPRGLCVPVLTQVPALDPSRTWREVWTASLKNPPCPDPIWSAMTDEEVMQQTVAIVQRRNIIGVLSGTPERVRRWSLAAPGRFIPSVQFQLGPDVISPGSLRRLFESGSFAVLGEVENQYVGIAPDDARMKPVLGTRREARRPGRHSHGRRPARSTLSRFPEVPRRLTSPFLLEDVLIRHPRLRVSVMHYASPLIDEMIAMLGAYPQLYVDIGGIQWFYPRPYFYEQLRRLIDAGFGKRVMFGSDQMNWPGMIERAIAIVEEAPFLSGEQKRDIFYNNAARFLRLSEKEIAKHHGR